MKTFTINPFTVIFVDFRVMVLFVSVFKVITLLYTWKQETCWAEPTHMFVSKLLFFKFHNASPKYIFIIKAINRFFFQSDYPA